jgi:hypothetical protein
MKVRAFHLLPIIAAFLLAACGPSFEEKGFASEEEAERLATLGFPTFRALMERGRFQDAKQAREAVSKGFYELDDYESALYEEYQSDSYSLEDVIPLAAGFSKASRADNLLGWKISDLSVKYPVTREWDAAKATFTVTSTATPEICDLMRRGAEQVQDVTLQQTWLDLTDLTCEGELSLAESEASQEKEKTSSSISPGTALIYDFRCTGVSFTGYTGDLRINSGSKTATWMKMDYKEDFTETDSFWSAYFPTLQTRLYFDKRTDLLTITDKFDREEKYQC